MKKRVLSLILCLVMLVGVVPAGAIAADTADDFMRIFHLDCGRKYFSVAEIEGIIDSLAENHYTHMELAFGNNGLRFLLDDMTVIANGKSYASDSVKSAIKAGNTAYTTASTGELSESEMTEIITYANDNGIEIIPLLNSPGHMNALLYAMNTLDGTNYSYNYNPSYTSTTLDVTNAKAVALAQAIISKYVDYFAKEGCRYFNFGADEFDNNLDKYNDDSRMGFGHLLDKGNYNKYAEYLNGMASIIKEADMTPMAFNDGIYFQGSSPSPNETVPAIDTDILVCYWSSGWGNYKPCSAEFLADKDFSIINTNQRWYYVLGRHSAKDYNLANAQNHVGITHYDSICGDSGSVRPVGCMMCL